MQTFIWGLLSLCIAALGTLAIKQPLLARTIVKYLLQANIIFSFVIVYRYVIAEQTFQESKRALDAKFISNKYDDIAFDSLLMSEKLYPSWYKLDSNTRRANVAAMTIKEYEVGIKMNINKRVDELIAQSFEDHLELLEYCLLGFLILGVLYVISVLPIKPVKENKV